MVEIRRVEYKALNRASESGSGTVLALGIIAVILVLTVLVAGLIGVVTANQRAATAADLSALAAADASRGLTAGEPCEIAQKIAQENRATLKNCAHPETMSGTVDVRVSTTISGPLAWLGDAESISRAGPP